MTVKQLSVSLKGEPPKRSAARTLATPPITGKKVPLQLKIAEEERRKFKIEAVTRGIDNSNLFIEMWEEYKKQHSI